MNLDVQSITFLQSFQNPLFDLTSGFFSILFIFWIILGFLLVLYFVHREKALFSALIGLPVTAFFTYLIKLIVQRPRPGLALFPKEITFGYGYSFPSGHTALAFAIATIVSKYYPKYSKIFFGFAFLSGISRIYLGVHYLSDVLFGAFIGIIVGALVIKKEKSIFKIEAKLNKAIASFLEI